jgi:hypothetical protein
MYLEEFLKEFQLHLDESQNHGNLLHYFCFSKNNKINLKKIYIKCVYKIYPLVEFDKIDICKNGLTAEATRRL